MRHGMHASSEPEAFATLALRLYEAKRDLHIGYDGPALPGYLQQWAAQRGDCA